MLKGLVLGGAACVWEDAERALELFEPDAVVAVKDMIADWPGRVDYGVTLHPERTVGYLNDRAAKGYPCRPQIWGHQNSGTKGLIDRQTTDWGGSSGLLAVKVLLEEGFDRIVLAGVPMTGKLGHYKRGSDWLYAKNYTAGWKAHLDEIHGSVRSMSGWTRDLLGEPDQVWLATT